LAYLKEHNKANEDKGTLTTDGRNLNDKGNDLAAQTVSASMTLALRMAALNAWIGKDRGLAVFDRPTIGFRSEDKIIFFGDSITSGGTQPHGYITLLDRRWNKQHPDVHVLFVNSGISGHKVPNLQARLHSDVLSKKPNLLFIYIGINDVWHETAWDGSGTPAYAFAAGLRHIIEKAQGRGATVVLATPSVIGEKRDGTNELDPRLNEYADISRKTAQEMGVTLCDLRQSFLDFLRQFNVDNKERGILTVDRVHLNDMGNMLVAHKAAEAIGIALQQRGAATAPSGTKP
jgi:lysophospholipase L1-like esterase